MRPQKIRRVKCEPGERCFIPRGKSVKGAESGLDGKSFKGSANILDEVYVALDEFEAVRLADVEGLKQEEAAEKMGVSRPTFSRIINSAHQKIGDALVNIKRIRIEGGCCEVMEKRKRRI